MKIISADRKFSFPSRNFTAVQLRNGGVGDFSNRPELQLLTNSRKPAAHCENAIFALRISFLFHGTGRNVCKMQELFDLLKMSAAPEC
jgi:hypothetical protein